MSYSMLAALTVDGVVATVAYAVVGSVMLVIGTAMADVATPGPLTERLRAGSANAAAVIIGNLFAVAAIVFAAALDSPDDLAEGLGSMAGYGALGIVAQTVMLAVVDRLLGIDFEEMFAEQALVPAAAVVAAVSLALGAVMVVAVV